MGVYIEGLEFEGVKRHFDRTLLTSVCSEGKKERPNQYQVQESQSVRENHKPWVQHNL
jgi:hypothetical protein